MEGQTLEGIDWDDFRVFLAVVETGSLHRASVALGLTQPTASKRLARLEKALKVRLFDRDRSGSRLTREGTRVFADVSAARLALSRAAKNAQAAKRRIDGDCKVVMGDGLANFWLPHFLEQFFDRFPNIELKLFVSTDQLAGKNDLFDVQLHYFQPVESDSISIRLGTLHFVPFASPAYLARHGRPRTIRELAEHRLLGHAAYLIDKGSWASWSKDAPTEAMSLLTNQSGPLAWSVKLGVGIALLPTYITVVDEEYVPIDLGQQFRTPIFMSFKRDAAKKSPVRTTVDFLRDVVFDKKQMPWFAEAYQPAAPEWRALFQPKPRSAAVIPYRSAESTG